MPMKKPSRQDVFQWSVEELASWLSKNKYSEAKERVKRLRIDGREFLKTPLAEVKSKFHLNNDKARKLEEILDELQQEYHESFSDESFDDVADPDDYMEVKGLYELGLENLNDVSASPSVERPLPPTPQTPYQPQVEGEYALSNSDEDLYLNQAETTQLISPYIHPHQDNNYSSERGNDLLRGEKSNEERPVTVKYAMPQPILNKHPRSPPRSPPAPFTPPYIPTLSPPPIPTFPPPTTPNSKATSPSYSPNTYIQSLESCSEIYEDGECDYKGNDEYLKEVVEVLPRMNQQHQKTLNNNLQICDNYETLDDKPPCLPPFRKNELLPKLESGKNDKQTNVQDASSHELFDDYLPTDDLPCLPPPRKEVTKEHPVEPKNPQARPRGAAVPAWLNKDNRIQVSSSIIKDCKNNLNKVTTPSTPSPKPPQTPATSKFPYKKPIPQAISTLQNPAPRQAVLPNRLKLPIKHKPSALPKQSPQALSLNSTPRFKPPTHAPPIEPSLHIKKHLPKVPSSPNSMLKNKPWYREIIRKEATSILEQNRKNGTFMIRPSGREKDKPYTLVLFVDGVRNVPIRRTQQDRFALGMCYKNNENTFVNLEEMVKYYKKYEVEVMVEGQKKATKLMDTTLKTSSFK